MIPANQTERKKILISNPDYQDPYDSPILLRIILSAEESKFDFGYQTSGRYVRGGWITISPKTFLRCRSSSKKYPLIKATNIPYGPEKLFFKSSIDWRYFSLYFPPIPEFEKFVDLIEADPGTPDDFNFLNIRLDDPKKIDLIY